LHRGILADKDLLIAVGGDGTTLNASSFLDDDIPIVGVNSDPTRSHEFGAEKKTDERRSTGQLCAATAENLDDILPQILAGDYYPPRMRTRIQCRVRSTYKTTKLPPALNDILITHPIPAAVSRFRLKKLIGTGAEYFTPGANTAIKMADRELFSFNIWSSGMWVSTATGSTAAMKAAGGIVQDVGSGELQYMVREHLLDMGHRRKIAIGAWAWIYWRRGNALCAME
jgi:NAD+ kinase